MQFHENYNNIELNFVPCCEIIQFKLNPVKTNVTVNCLVKKIVLNL